MKNIIVLFFFIIFNVTNFSEVWANLNNSIIVKVDKKIITNFEVKNKILRTLIISGNEINQLNINNLKKQTLDSLINLKLKEIELENVDLKINKKRIDSYINLISKNKPQELRSKLNNYNLDFDLFLKEIETELKWQQFIFKKYSNRIKIDEVFIEKEVEKIFSSQVKNYEVNLSEIEIFHNNNKTKCIRIAEVYYYTPSLHSKKVKKPSSIILGHLGLRPEFLPNLRLIDLRLSFWPLRGLQLPRGQSSLSGNYKQSAI